MGQLSPNPIRVGDTATASLSASYSQPGNVPEGTYPTPQYSWSVSVQYKPLYADSYGAPPSNSYTLSISPSQPSSTGGAQVSFTPLIAGYWQLTGICDVTLTDQAGNDYWTGSGIAAPVDITSVQVTISPKNGSTTFLNTYYFVQVTYAPSDLAATLNISGGPTFAGGATSEAMTSNPEAVDFYGPNVYSTGSTGTGQISVTVSVPQSGAALTKAPTAAPSIAGFGGGTLTVKAPLGIFSLKDLYKQGYSNMVSALSQSAVNIIMPNLESNTNSYLDSLMSENGPQAMSAGEEYEYLNSGGYSTLGGTIQTLLNDMATGESNVPSTEFDLLDEGTTPVLEIPGVPPSALKNFSLTPSITATFRYPYISSNGTWQAPKLGDLLATFGITGSGPISDDTYVPISGTWTGSLSATLAAGHNFTLQDGNYSASVGIHISLFDAKNVQFEMQAMGTFTPDNGNLSNDLAGQVFLGVSISG